MATHRIRFVPLAALLTAAPALTAQVPDGAAVIATQTRPGGQHIPGNPGLFLAPLSGGAITRVTGLPTELTTDSHGAWGQGAYSVSIRSGDGAIIVTTISGPRAPTGGVVKLWVFHLNGAAVVPGRTRHLDLGTATTLGAALNRVLPDGRILVGAADNGRPFTNGPLRGHLLGIVDTSGATLTVTPLPNPVITRAYVGGMAIAPAGDGLYFVESDTVHVSPTDASVKRYDLTTGATCRIATLPGESAFGITCDDDGTIHVSATNPTTGTHSIYSVVPNGCNPVSATRVQSANLLLAAGLDLDRAAGRFVVGSLPGSSPGTQFNALSSIDPVTGASTVVASAPAGGWGRLSKQGVAVNNAIQSYGRSSDGTNRHWFDNFPNPGGQPAIGHGGFTLTMKSAPAASTLSVLALSFGRGSTPFFGIEILVDLGTTVAVVVPSARTATYPLPIPNAPNLRGGVVTAQSLHVEGGGGFASSRGLEITIQ